jgi:exosome complex RNA-binding protein Rrp4
MIDLSMGLKLILGMNGWIWFEPIDSTDEEAFEKIAKLVNILKLFEENYIGVRLETVLNCYNMAKDRSSNEIVQGALRDQLVDFLAKTVNEISKEKISDIIANKK